MIHKIIVLFLGVCLHNVLNGQQTELAEVTEEQLAELQRMDQKVDGALHCLQETQRGIQSMSALADKLTNDTRRNSNSAPKAVKRTDDDLSVQMMSDVVEALVMGKKFFCGDDLPQNFSKALACFEKVARQNENKVAQAWAWLWLGKHYHYGYGVKKERDKARAFFEKAVNQTCNKAAQVQAMAALAGNLYTKYKTTNDFERYQPIIEEYLANAEMQTIDDDARGYAFFWRGYIDNDKGDVGKAKVYFEKLASHRNKELSSCAALFWGECFLRGCEGVQRDYEKARELLELAAKQEVHKSVQSSSLCTLGEMHFLGLGVQPNARLAEQFFTQAYRLGQQFDEDCYASAAYWLAYIKYTAYKDRPTSISKEKTAQILKLLEIAENEGHNSRVRFVAWLSHGALYHFAIGVTKDINKAKFYYQKAEQQNSDPACAMAAALNLGILYCWEEEDYSKASAYLLKVSEQNQYKDLHFQARVGLGEVYFHGFHEHQKDYRKAQEYFENALAPQPVGADDSCRAIAWLRLGQIYLSSQKEVQGLEYLRKAAMQDEYAPAKEAAKRLLEKFNKSGSHNHELMKILFLFSSSALLLAASLVIK